jgi:EpsI family protein
MTGSRFQASRREFLVGGALLGTAAASQFLTGAAHPSRLPNIDLDRLIPATIGEWSHVPGNAVIPKGEVGSDEVYDQVVARHYAGGALPPVMLLIAFGRSQGGTTQVHRPELCYPAAGFDILERDNLSLKVPGRPPLPARNLTAVAPGRTEQILYWTRIGRDFPVSGMEQRWSVLRQTVSGGLPDGVLARFSTIEAERGPAVATLRSFAVELMKAGSPALRQVLWGAA